LTSSQALQAGGLVGKSVLVKSNYAPYSSEKGMSGELNLESSATDVEVRIYDAAGSLVKTLKLGDQSSGQLPFKWDGSLDAGEYAPEGTYKVEADYFDGESRSPLSVLVSADVDSVVVGNSSTGLTLNLTGLGGVAFSDVSRIQ
jgi:flagellar basal-body rod modification protein FlgD